MLFLNLSLIKGTNAEYCLMRWWEIRWTYLQKKKEDNEDSPALKMWDAWDHQGVLITQKPDIWDCLLPDRHGKKSVQVSLFSLAGEAIKSTPIKPCSNHTYLSLSNPLRTYGWNAICDCSTSELKYLIGIPSVIWLWSQFTQGDRLSATNERSRC